MLPGAANLHGAEIRFDPLAAVELLEVTEERPGAFGVAGVQLKLDMSRDKDDRLVWPLSGALGDHLVKVPPRDTFRGLSENEHATMTWARRAGFDVPPTHLVDPSHVGDTLHRLRDGWTDALSYPPHVRSLVRAHWRKIPLTIGYDLP
ncbi:MAG: hypothetical protein ACI9K2_007551 [Myxococcota bacterium]